MRTFGIIAEYNPFHLGHLYQINKIKEIEPDSCIIVLVSSCFSQRGDISVMDKWERTKILLDNKIDMVVEFPFGYASQGADIFAKGAIKILGKLKIDTLVFGTEELDVDKLKEIAKVQLYNENYDKLVKELLDTGVNYPTAMATALYNITSLKIDMANDLLGLSYVKEIIRQNLSIDVIGIPRTNRYNSLDSDSDIISGTAIRKLINDKENVKKYVVNDKYIYYGINREMLYPLLKYQIINNMDNLDRYNTVDEGIDNRIRKVIYDTDSWEDLVFKIKTKRYTYNKINRMLVHILTNFTKEENKNIEIDYIRILGFSINGQRYLNSIKKDIKIPIITRYKKDISKLLDIEFRITGIYSSMFSNSNDIIKNEFRMKPVIKNK